MGSVVLEISHWSRGAIKNKMGKPFFNLVGPIRLLSAEKRTKRSIVPGPMDFISQFTWKGVSISTYPGPSSDEVHRLWTQRQKLQCKFQYLTIFFGLLVDFLVHVV